MLKRGLGHTLLVLAALTIFAASAAADSRARIVRLSFVEGNVQMDQHDGRGLQKAFLNMPIGQGTVLLTRDEGRAEVEFENGSTIRIARASQPLFTFARDHYRPTRCVGSRARKVSRSIFLGQPLCLQPCIFVWLRRSCLLGRV